MVDCYTILSSSINGPVGRVPSLTALHGVRSSDLSRTRDGWEMHVLAHGLESDACRHSWLDSLQLRIRGPY